MLTARNFGALSHDSSTYFKKYDSTSYRGTGYNSYIKIFFAEVRAMCGAEMSFCFPSVLSCLTNFNPSSNKISLHYSIEALWIDFYRTGDKDAVVKFLQCPNCVCFKNIRFKSDI